MDLTLIIPFFMLRNSTLINVDAYKFFNVRFYPNVKASETLMSSEMPVVM